MPHSEIRVSEKRKMRFYVSEIKLILVFCAVAALFVQSLILCAFIHRKVCSDVQDPQGV